MRHGGDLSSVTQGNFDQWLDLSTGINPYAYPVPAITDDAWTRLPDARSLQNLKQAACAYYGAQTPAGVVCSPGTQLLIQTLPHLFSDTVVGIVSPTYNEHERCWRATRHELRTLQGINDEEINDCQIVILVNPNNPDGRHYTRDELLELRSTLAGRGGFLIVDEAFGDLHPEHSVAGAAEDGGLIVLKSMGKFFGLAGMRAGFAIANRFFARRLEDRLGPWVVPGPTIEVASAALIDEIWAHDMRIKLGEIRTELVRILRQTGLEILGGTDLFTYVSSDRAEALFNHLLTEKIYIRIYPEREGYLRFGMPRRKDLKRLEKALGSF